MKSVVCQHAELSVVERETPVPGKGQLLIEVTRAGICGSDLHARHHCDELAGVMEETGYEDFMRSDQAITFGHEFTGRVAEHGPGCRKTAAEGAPVVALPLIRRGADVHTVGLSALAPGAYAEQMLVEESLAFPVPNGLTPDHAALTEPMAVGLHAVRRGDVKRRDVAIVIGCGPVGLSVILHLKAKGVRQVIASDFSPGRRSLALACGADLVIDPATDSPYETKASEGHLDDIPNALDMAVGIIEKAHRMRVPWWHLWRAVERAGVKPKHPVVFECVGVPGVIDEIIAKAPLYTRIVVVGLCMGADQIRPSMAINKEIDLRFVVAYSPSEYRESLQKLAEGEVDATPVLTGTVGLEGVDAAFTALGDPEGHAKIVIDPQRDGAEISS
jgi:threonine dehydrogenase-like Zn-dependent dehydrogenase